MKRLHALYIHFIYLKHHHHIPESNTFELLVILCPSNRLLYVAVGLTEAKSFML